ncbi:MAG: glycoside hydrolase family 43 protein [Anaerococcus sp.]|nr:glycoside hydrolase family 43 protein [Anaerococcus sp.]
MKVKNPILKGFNPDPSITKKDDEYYIATSTFEWFPGVQIHKSNDLVNWELISHPLDNEKFINMKGLVDSGGVRAPDLSYHDGLFWLVYSKVDIVNGNFKDCRNYLITSEDIEGPWSDPIVLNGLGFDASLFHDDNKKYLVQMQWDHRSNKHPFYGIRCTEYNHKLKKLIPENSKIIWKGTDKKLTEGPHIYKLKGKYYLFCAEGGTQYEHSEVVARSDSIFGNYEVQNEIFLTAYDSPKNPLQKCGHGSLIQSNDDQWYFVHISARPWHEDYESSLNPRGWCTLGRETSLQKVIRDDEGWPHIDGGKQGSEFVEIANSDIINNDKPINQYEDFSSDELNINFNTVRVPFNNIGRIKNNMLFLEGKGSLSNTQEHSLVARRWQSHYFTAETKVTLNPNTYQNIAGLANYYNSNHWSMIGLTYDENKGKVIEILETDRGETRTLINNKITIDNEIESVYFRCRVSRNKYKYYYSLDGKEWIDTKIYLNSKILSDDYVAITNGGFFTGAFVGMVNIDYSGYNNIAYFDYFKYEEDELSGYNS